MRYDMKNSILLIENSSIFLNKILRATTLRFEIFSLLIGIIVLTYSTSVFGIEVENYSNKFGGIAGMIYSEKYGLVYSNSSGVFSIDIETGEIKQFFFQSAKNNFSFNRFFKYRNEIYLYYPGDSLYCVKDDYIVSITNNVESHFVNDKLYLIKNKEPRIEVISESGSTLFDLGDKGYNLCGNFCELNNEVYGYMAFNSTGNRLLFKITNDNKIEYLIDNNHPQYKLFKSYLCYEIYNVNGELWLKYFDGFKIYKDNKIEEVEEPYTLDDNYTYSMVCNNDVLYGINEKGIFKANISTKTTNYLINFDTLTSSTTSTEIINNTIYFFDGISIYTYNLIKNEFNTFPTVDKGTITAFMEGVDNNLIVAKDCQLEIYESEQPKIFSSNSTLTNYFYGIAFDKKNKKVVALGLGINKYYIQTFDGTNWEYNYIPIPNKSKYFEYDGKYDIKVATDLTGNYYVSILDYLLIWDGKQWIRKSFLTNPDEVIKKPKQDYSLLLTDSLNRVWLNYYTQEYNMMFGKYIIKNKLGWFSDTGFNVVMDVDTTINNAYFEKGIQTKKGVIAIKSDYKYFYEYEGKKELLTPEDGDTHELINHKYDICQNFIGDLIFCFNQTSGWHINYGEYSLPGGISIFDGSKWQHTYYKSFIEDYNLQLYNQQVVSDTYGYDYILTNEKIIRMGYNESIKVFTFENPFFTYNMKFMQIGNTIWCSHPEYGLYKFELPTIMSIDEKKYIEPKPFLKHEIVQNKLEIEIEILNYEIYTINGNLVDFGKNKNIIDITNLCNGAYFIVCNSMEGVAVQKFIVSR